ncbi:MAG: biotin--[acetyl-CoA-carboxylase] ligase [Dokdonella sp.]|nr:biotin--[acetyl-CoA-carboxylase] ligase [Dokdonella sp.]MBO9661422.1 biotin--[acetyl-CoA-carboxylase] ligase [Dokdonella sp.]
MPAPLSLQRAPARTPAPPPLLAELAGGEAVSGSALAARLGISRAAVWKQIERLRELGLEIGAQAGSGYRLATPLERLDEATIRAALAPAERARLGDLVVHWQLDSTSSELQRRAGDDPRDGLACLAEIQSAGRGRRGRAWRMPLGGGLALSLLKRFDDGMAALGGLSLVAGVAAVKALADCGVDGVGLKWPNDLLAHGRKLGGILVELGGDATGPCHAIVGIGLNLRLDPDTLAAIDQPAIDLASLSAGEPPSRNRLAARLLAQFGAAFERFAHSGFDVFADEYARFDLLRDRPVRVLRAGAAEDGLARGIDARGALRVVFADGERRVDGGEVSVRGTGTDTA